MNVTEHVADVNDATAIVIGKYAVVGIDVKDDLDRSKVETIKYSVAKALKMTQKVRMLLSSLTLIQ